VIIISRDQGQNRRIRIQKPEIRTPEEEKLWREVHKYAELIPSELEPNFGRVRELKEEIKNGTYLIPEMIDETAARLAIRFTRKE
jgi:hypothetical protein